MMKDPASVRICILKMSDVTYIARVHRCAGALAHAGYDVSVFSIAPRELLKSENYPYKNVMIPIKSRLLKSYLFSPLRIIEGIIRMISGMYNAKANIYMPHDLEGLIVASLVTRINGGIIIYNSDELEAERNVGAHSSVHRGVNRVRRYIESILCHRCKAVIAADHARAEVMNNIYKLARVEVVRNIPPIWRGTTDNRIRKSLNLQDSAAVLLYQGLINQGRGVEICVKVLSEVGRHNVHLVLLGFCSETYRTKLENIAKELDVSEKLHFLPPVLWYELLDWTASATISMVLIENTCLSYYCAAPNKFYETIMVGIPYIASNFPEMRRVHNTTQGGILVDPSDLKEIVSAVELLLSDSVSYSKMQNCSRTAALSELNWETEQIRLLDILSNALHN